MIQTNKQMKPIGPVVLQRINNKKIMIYLLLNKYSHTVSIDSDFSVELWLMMTHAERAQVRQTYGFYSWNDFSMCHSCIWAHWTHPFPLTEVKNLTFNLMCMSLCLNRSSHIWCFIRFLDLKLHELDDINYHPLILI